MRRRCRARARACVAGAERHGAPHGLHYAVSIDTETPQIVNVTADSSLRAWEPSVADNVTIGVTRHHLANAGEHVLKYCLVDPGLVLERIAVDADGVQPGYLGPLGSRRGDATMVGPR